MIITERHLRAVKGVTSQSRVGPQHPSATSMSSV
jgi:hypothetical protein